MLLVFKNNREILNKNFLHGRISPRRDKKKYEIAKNCENAQKIRTLLYLAKKEK
jgi:hypothetical protein